MEPHWRPNGEHPRLFFAKSRAMLNSRPQMVKKRAVIVEPNRDKRLQLAAVLKGEHLQIVMLEGDNDLLTDAQNNDADLIVLRAEMDRQSGYSICNRLRSNERSSGSKIVIV